MKDDPQLVIALYASPRNDPLDWSTWITWCKELVGRGSLEMTNFDVGLVRPSKNLKTGKAYSLTQLGRLQEEIRNLNVDRISFTSVKSPKRSISMDWNFTAVLDQRNDSIQFIVGFSLTPFKVLGTPAEINDSMVQAAISFFEPDYGFGVCDDPITMPAAYAQGVASSRLPETLIYDANDWLADGVTKCNKALRNVYGYNLLNDNHLNSSLWKLTLKEWIQAEPGRGVLRSVSNRLTRWDFKNIGNGIEYLAFNSDILRPVRAELEKYVLFPWQSLPGVRSYGTDIRKRS